MQNNLSLNLEDFRDSNIEKSFINDLEKGGKWSGHKGHVSVDKEKLNQYYDMKAHEYELEQDLSHLDLELIRLSEADQTYRHLGEYDNAEKAIKKIKELKQKRVATLNTLGSLKMKMNKLKTTLGLK